MQQDNKEQSPAPGTIFNPISAGAATQKQQPESPSNTQINLEFIMLLFGFAAILCLLFNQGFFLKIFAGVFLMTAIFSIVRNTQKTGSLTGSITQSNTHLNQEVKKHRSLVKVLGIGLLLIALAPVVLYGGFFILIIIFLVIGGGLSGGDANFGS